MSPASTVEELEKSHYAQVKNYLKTTRIRLGLLINFGNPTLQFKRIIVCRFRCFQ
ncbi:MAG: GxxExxY protein [bacterium]